MDVIDLAKEYASPLLPILDNARMRINRSCEHLEAWQVIFFTASVTLLLVWVYAFLFDKEKTPWERFKEWIFRSVRKLPVIGTLIAKEVEKFVDDVAKDSIFAPRKGEVITTELPPQGLGKEVIERISCIEEIMGGADWRSGRVSGTVYGSNEELHDCLVQVYGKFVWSNPLHPDVFPAVRKMESEVVQMCVNMFHGSKDACGSVTSGGTESILMACRAYRQLAFERGIERPEIVVPASTHCAFDKAAEYFRMKIVHVPVEEQSRRANVREMQRAINRNTVLLVASAPQFPHGVIDPVEEIARLGRKYDISVHVDCCLGGFLLPFMEEAGFKVPPFDFRVPGVTSISADTHKYGYAPKGSSVVMYANRQLRHMQYFVAPDWQGGIYASPSIAGSRAGGVIAACWAAMMFTGRDGYVECTRKIITTTRLIDEELRKVPGLIVLGKPDASVVAFASDEFDIFRLGGALTSRGWNLNNLQYPSSIHLCVTLRHTESGVAEKFLADVRECATEIMKDPKQKATGNAAMYGMAQMVPDRSLIKEIAWGFLDACVAMRD